MSETEIAMMAAQATIESARIQGVSTFLAGLAALAGGYLAYRGAIAAADRQTRLEESRHKARVRAYLIRIVRLTDDLYASLKLAVQLAKIGVQRVNQGGDPNPVAIPPLSRIPDFTDEHWRDHALMGGQVVQAIHDVDQRLTRYMEFQSDVVEMNLRSSDHWAHARVLSRTKEPDDSCSPKYSTVGEDNEFLATGAFDAVARLRVELNQSTIGWGGQLSRRCGNCQ